MKIETENWKLERTKGIFFLFLALTILAGTARATDYTWKGNAKFWDDTDNSGQTWWYDGAAYGADFATVNQSGNKLTVDGTAPGECRTDGATCNAALYINSGGTLMVIGSSTATNLHMNGGTMLAWYWAVDVLMGNLCACPGSDSSLYTGTGEGTTTCDIQSQLSGSGALTVTGHGRIKINNSANASSFNGTILSGDGFVSSSVGGSFGGTLQLGGVGLELNGPVNWVFGADISGNGPIAPPYVPTTTTLTMSGRSIKPGTASSRGTVSVALEYYGFYLKTVFASANGTNAELRLDIAAANDYDKLVIACNVADALTGLANCNLVVNFIGSPSFAPSDALTIVELTGASGNIGGTKRFANLVHVEDDDGDSDTWKVDLGNGWEATIDYSGGTDGNDVILKNIQRPSGTVILFL